MRIAVLSDIHANLEALEEALSSLKTHAVDEIVCLGDVVGYGANPNECLSLILETTPHILFGNHDQAAVDLHAAESFNPFAYAAARWTHEHLTNDRQKLISRLPYTLDFGGLFFVHSSPYQPESWHYIITSDDARDNFDHFDQPVCFVGHSHVPAVFTVDRVKRKSAALDKTAKYIINVGSVGQPRDGDPRLSFGVFDTSTWTYEPVRLEYDVETASEKIRKAGLPRMLADRLLYGR